MPLGELLHVRSSYTTRVIYQDEKMHNCLEHFVHLAEKLSTWLYAMKYLYSTSRGHQATYLFFKFGDNSDIEKWIWVCSYSCFAWRKFVWCTSQLFILLMRERKREWIQGILIISIFGLVFEIILRYVNRNVGAD